MQTYPVVAEIGGKQEATYERQYGKYSYSPSFQAFFLGKTKLIKNHKVSSSWQHHNF